MFTKKLTSISIATLATLAAFTMSAPSASAKSFHISIGHGHGHGHWGHGHWRHRRHFGIYAPVVYSSAAYLPECYYVRRYGRLFKVCQ
jgi:hypothetical protein